MRFWTCLVIGLALAASGCGQNLGPRGANRNEDRPKMTDTVKKDDKPRK